MRNKWPWQADPQMHFGDGTQQLTYCTNIHPANGWPDVLANLEAHAPALKSRFSPNAPFGLGLRLSAEEARQLLTGNSLPEFRDYLKANGLYVALINGYPHGHFFGDPVKADVFAPDWRTEERARYTLDLIEILAVLLPEGTDGGVSTVPLSYKPWISDVAGVMPAIATNLARVCERLVQIRRETGKVIHVDIEPEPDGLIENTSETIAFFATHLPQHGAPVLAQSFGVSVDEAAAMLREHIRLCYDTCHFAVEYEDPAASLAAF